MSEPDSPAPTPGGEKLDADQLSRVIMLIYGKLETGGPFWCYVAVKPSQFERFKQAEKDGNIDLYNFDEFGEVVVSAEGEKPPADVTAKVAELYGTDPADFFKPIDPMQTINEKMDEFQKEIDKNNQG